MSPFAIRGERPMKRLHNRQNEENNAEVAELSRELNRERALRLAAETAQARAQALLELAPDGIVIVAGDGRISYVNNQAEEMFGYDRDELLGKPIEVLIPERYRDIHIIHREHFAAEPRTRPMGVGLELYGLRRDGSEFPVEIALGPMRTEEGLFITAIIRDISAWKAAVEEIKRLNEDMKRRATELEAASREIETFNYSVSDNLREQLRSVDTLNQEGAEVNPEGQDDLQRVRVATQKMRHLIDDLLMLSQVSRAASSITDMQELLNSTISELCGITTFDMCLIGLIDEDRQELYHGASCGTLSGNWQKTRVPMGKGLLWQAAMRHEALVVKDVTGSSYVYGPFVHDENVRTAVAAPILYAGKLLGVLFTGARSHREVPEREVRLLEDVTSIIAVAIQNAKAYKREHNIAATLQSSLLPDVPENIGEFEFAKEYAPALQEAEVGGDFYDVFRIDERRYGVVIGDVSGKGLHAAVGSIMARYGLRAFASENADPSLVLCRLNDSLLLNMKSDMFVTILFGVVDMENGEVIIANAGHEPPVIYRAQSQSSELLEIPGTAAGIIPNVTYETRRISLNYGDSILMYTDGVTDARRNSEFFSQDRLAAQIPAVCPDGCGASSLVSQIREAVFSFAEGKVHDDIALLAVSRRHPDK